mmetsp:Transcript_2417/g.7476  ORF Transcript_2417/g.7476 Transcript_2417/m.7476 type:complete len:140 (-) Transcript_2417:229-648(-)|eukprot:CAMPEP_0182605338 /NCGR_PEP_ID=MMETSP1330-20130603/285_1 /TAXON_ID=464278 /ORGANISM="Picochlorum sp., Strain RCC944" /LENGTH=139 /DNA_ID=CAMNT_0024823305 /DNA_START=38 /DNA_END=457 /DNA_ORIENTATION=+
MQTVSLHRMEVARVAGGGSRFGDGKMISFGNRTGRLSSRPLSSLPSLLPLPLKAASSDKEQTSDMTDYPTPDATVSFDWVDTFVKRMGRYDFLSAGLPSLAVVSVFVANGQDPWKALSIAFCATVLAVAANEVLFEDGK